MIWTALIIIQVLLALFLIVTNRSRSKEEPPLDKGFVPWLGHAIDFGKDAATFLTRMKSKHGKIFTVRVAGLYVTVLLDPNSYDSIIKDSTSFDFTRYAHVLMKRIFNLHFPQHNPETEKAMMRQHFQDKSLITLNRVMQKNLQALLMSEVCENKRNWKNDSLFSLCYSLLFRAGYLTLFGDEPEENGNISISKEIFQEFRKFDALLTKMARTTLKTNEKKVASTVKERLWDLLSQNKLNSKMNPSSWLESYRRYLTAQGVDQKMQQRAMLLQLWATQGNVGPAAFWMLAFLLTNPEAMTAVKNEFHKLTAEVNRTCKVQTVRPEMLEKTPVFDSALNETLRLTAAPFITREVLQTKTIRLADGREYKLRKGDRICLFPYLSPQMDPEIHQEPKKFKHDRFLNADGTEKKDFFKDGKKLKYYTMPWGAGKNVCVGRSFAISSIKQFIFMVLTCLDIRLCDPGSPMPDIDAGRYGFGMLQPQGDLEIQYKLKSHL
ncbi:prostacyclin synthase [Lepisosteus oculatus]|uniref:Prostacyclin synthase n=1 Tax=Lepisosteus oculatus TaxID=7918 RepID=W5M5X4_LEPOC|nr:PREDICTED: prostacyclin synthase [Lepisosteus oculatus]